jgi:hypothetical protein
MSVLGLSLALFPSFSVCSLFCTSIEIEFRKDMFQTQIYKEISGAIVTWGKIIAPY